MSTTIHKRTLPTFRNWFKWIAGFLFVTASVQAQIIAADLQGKLVELKDKSTQPVKNFTLGQAKYIAFYCGAGWCGPCHRFTPELVKLYTEMKPKYPNFEVVFVSDDRSAVEMQNYMAEMSMPFPAVRWEAVRWSKAEKLCGPGIPCLVVIDQNDHIVSNSFEGQNYVGPYKVIEDLRKLLTETGGAVAAENTMSPAPLRTATPPSPSGTNWDKVFKKKP
jgi:thiol-disulfide isomerase/thioredoxin